MTEPAMVSKEDMDLCEAENANLRKHLAWAAQLLPPEKQAELRERLEQPIQHGGVVEDSIEEDDKYITARDQAIGDLCDLMQSAIDSPQPPPEEWYFKCDLYATRLREFLRPSREATLASIRNMSDM